MKFNVLAVFALICFCAFVNAQNNDQSDSMNELTDRDDIDWLCFATKCSDLPGPDFEPQTCEEVDNYTGNLMKCLDTCNIDKNIVCNQVQDQGYICGQVYNKYCKTSNAAAKAIALSTLVVMLFFNF